MRLTTKQSFVLEHIEEVVRTSRAISSKPRYDLHGVEVDYRIRFLMIGDYVTKAPLAISFGPRKSLTNGHSAVEPMVVIVSHHIIKEIEKLIEQETALRDRLIRNGHDPSAANEVLALMDLIHLAPVAQHQMLLDKTLMMMSSAGSLH